MLLSPTMSSGCSYKSQSLLCARQVPVHGVSSCAEPTPLSVCPVSNSWPRNQLFHHDSCPEPHIKKLSVDPGARGSPTVKPGDFLQEVTPSSLTSPVSALDSVSHPHHMLGEAQTTDVEEGVAQNVTHRSCPIYWATPQPDWGIPGPLEVLFSRSSMTRLWTTRPMTCC